MTGGITQPFICSRCTKKGNAAENIRGLMATYPLIVLWPPPARTQVEEWGTGSKETEGEHHLHNGHKDEGHPQDDCGRLNDTMTPQRFFMHFTIKDRYIQCMFHLHRSEWGQRGIRMWCCLRQCCQVNCNASAGSLLYVILLPPQKWTSPRWMQLPKDLRGSWWPARPTAALTRIRKITEDEFNAKWK